VPSLVVVCSPKHATKSLLVGTCLSDLRRLLCGAAFRVLTLMRVGAMFDLEWGRGRGSGLETKGLLEDKLEGLSVRDRVKYTMFKQPPAST
jgi:hypothetical protein